MKTKLPYYRDCLILRTLVFGERATLRDAHNAKVFASFQTNQNDSGLLMEV